MNLLTSTITGTYVPISALVVYEHAGTDGRSFYIEHHPIGSDGHLGAGRPLQQETLQSMSSLLSDNMPKEFPHGPVPPGLLYFEVKPGGRYKLAWWSAPCRREVFFSKGTGLKSGQCHVPGTIFMVDGKNLWAWAVKGNAIPGEQEPLFHGPYHNLSDNGKMCLGNARAAKPRARTFNAIINYWEQMFFSSEFTHESGDMGKVARGNLKQAWAARLKKPSVQFDDSLLVPYKNKGQQVLLRQIFTTQI